MADTTWTPEYRSWRGGGWYVDNVRYPSGAVGCVSRNYADKKWRIVCDRDFTRTFRTRDDAARAEREDTIRMQAEQANSHAVTETSIIHPRCCACREYIEREDNFCPGCGAQLHAMALVDAQIARKKHAERSCSTCKRTLTAWDTFNGAAQQGYCRDCFKEAHNGQRTDDQHRFSEVDGQSRDRAHRGHPLANQIDQRTDSRESGHDDHERTLFPSTALSH